MKKHLLFLSNYGTIVKNLYEVATMDLLRIWQEADIKDVQEHILMADELFGFCLGCKTPGLKLQDLKKCPQCGREFIYITSKDVRGHKSAEVVMRLKKKLPHLLFVDYDDYERLVSKNKAADLFKNM